jgi:predicted TIM-barrel fold metal-dependent hydrolase
VVEAKLTAYVDGGIRGYGEHKTGLPFTHPLSMDIYHIAGELGLPVLFHMDNRLNTDDVGLPGLERVLRELPGTTFIAHAQLWWAHISAEVDPSVGYPQGPVAPGGAVDRLLATYPNLYADLSAFSGYNAVTRDPEFTAGFLERNWSRLLFGTDYLAAAQELPIVEWLEQYPLDEAKKAAIWGGTLGTLLRPV